MGRYPDSLLQRRGGDDKTMKRHILGTGLTILAACCFGLIPLFAKTAYDGGFSPYSFSLFRSVFTAVILLVILKGKGTALRLTRKQALTLLNAAFFGYYLMMVTLCVAYQYMDTGLATTLHFIYPVATMAGAVVMYKEKINGGRIGALAASLIGIFLVTGMGGSFGTMNLTGVILALSSGFFYAWYILTVSGSRVGKLDAPVIIFYIVLYNTILLFFTCLFMGDFPGGVTFKGVMGTVAVAVVSSVIGMVAFHAGLKRISAVTAAIISSFEVVTSLLVGAAFLGERFTLTQITGSVLIMGAVITVALSKESGNSPDCP